MPGRPGLQFVLRSDLACSLFQTSLWNIRGDHRAPHQPPGWRLWQLPSCLLDGKPRAPAGRSARPHGRLRRADNIPPHLSSRPPGRRRRRTPATKRCHAAWPASVQQQTAATHVSKEAARQAAGSSPTWSLRSLPPWPTSTSCRQPWAGPSQRRTGSWQPRSGTCCACWRMAAAMGAAAGARCPPTGARWACWAGWPTGQRTWVLPSPQVGRGCACLLPHARRL